MGDTSKSGEWLVRLLDACRVVVAPVVRGKTRVEVEGAAEEGPGCIGPTPPRIRLEEYEYCNMLDS